MAFIPITLTIAAGCTLIGLWLQIRVGQVRRSARISIGDGGSEPLIRRMRAQANYVENAPFVLALILAIELSRGPSVWLWAAGGVFLLARVAHGFGMDGMRYARSFGTAATMAVLLGLAVWAAVIARDGRVAGGPTTTASPARA